MKIALLTDGIYPYVIGGMQKHSFNLVKYFARNKVYVDLYHTNHSEYDISRLEFFSDDEKKYIRSIVVQFPSFGSLPGHYIRESFEYSTLIFELFSKNCSDIDFIYAKGFTAWKLLDEKRNGYQCVPVGVNFHGYEMFQKPASLRSRMEQILLRKPVVFNIINADYVFSYGGRITEIILNLGIKNEKIIESPAGIEKDWIVPEIHSSEGVRKFIFVGRYERRKGVEELTRVLSNLAMNNNFEFTFVGEIPEKKKILLPCVKYLGKITDGETLKSILRNSHVLVCPSYSEGMPNVILEAMASGLAIIASDVGAINTMVNLTTGWLIKPGQTMELKSAIINVINMSTRDLDILRRNALFHVRDNFLFNEVMIKLLNNISLLGLVE